LTLPLLTPILFIIFALSRCRYHSSLPLLRLSPSFDSRFSSSRVDCLPFHFFTYRFFLSASLYLRFSHDISPIRFFSFFISLLPLSPLLFLSMLSDFFISSAAFADYRLFRLLTPIRFTSPSFHYCHYGVVSSRFSRVAQAARCAAASAMARR